MAVYEKLLLNTGGGIVYTGKQSEQVKGTVTLLIGLGGTGISAIRRIKTEVYSRLKSDNGDPIRPEYKHIKFLGIDADGASKGINDKGESLLCLDDNEFMQLIDTGIVKNAFKDSTAIQGRKDLEWLKYEDIPAATFAGKGAGACRQMGRYQLLEQSDVFSAKVSSMLKKAKQNINIKPDEHISIQVHVFSGISGGTGSGTFLDACYLMKKCLDQEKVTIFGYVFLPDINMSLTANEIDKESMSINGYAAMQEIDYCMQLPGNGGSFKQVYKGVGSVDWNQPPVDMCHLIGGEPESGIIPGNSYEYAMHVVAEYVMDFLTQPEDVEKFGIVSHINNFLDKINTIDGKKNHGVNVRYATIGAAGAVMPYKLMNTYLASKFFEAFKDVRYKKPDDMAVKKFAMNVIANSEDNYDKLYKKLHDRIQGKVSMDFDLFPFDWKYIKDSGAGDEAGEAAFTHHYTNQEGEKIANIKTNAEALMGEGNLSLKGLLKKYMTNAICDSKRGPFYALGYIDKAQSTNLINIIDGLIEGNRKKKSQYLHNNSEVDKQYRNNRKEFFDTLYSHNPFVNHKKSFNKLEDSLFTLSQYDVQIYIYDKIEEVLEQLKKDIEEVVPYYRTFQEIIRNLMDTFNQNLKDINGGLIKEDSFAIQMIDIKDAKFMKYLDSKVAAVNPINQVSSLMQLLLDNDDKWKENDLETELNVSKLIVDFFTNQMFSDFAQQTFDQLLEQKYGTNNLKTLISNIKNEYMDNLVTKATPMFKPNALGTDISNCKISYISVPNVSALIEKAASEEASKLDNGNNNTWNVKKTALGDRIFIMTSKVGLPMGSYVITENIEENYSSIIVGESVKQGLHYYEGYPNYKKIPEKKDYHLNNMLCDNWRKMGSLIPYSHREIDNVPIGIKEILKHNSKVFDEAVRLEIIQLNGEIKKLDPNKKIEILNEVETINKLIGKIENEVQYTEVEKSFKELKSHLKIITTSNNYVSTTLTKLSAIGRMDANASSEEIKTQTYKLMKDYLINAIEQVEIVKSYVNEINKVKDAVKEVEDNLKKVNDEIIAVSKFQKIFFNALFTGVVECNKGDCSYTPEGFMKDKVVLSRMFDKSFKYSDLPLYQAFVTFMELDVDERNYIATKAQEILTNSLEREAVKENLIALMDIINNDKLKKEAKYASEYANVKDILLYLHNMDTEFGKICDLLEVKSN